MGGKRLLKILMILSNPLLVDPRVHKEAKALTDKGHKVTVIVWDRRKEYSPEDIIDDIRIIRVHNTTLMKKIPKDMLRNPLWWKEAYKKGLEVYKNDFKFDVVHCHDLDTLKPGVKLKKKTGCKLVFDAHEIFGYMIQKNNPIASKIAFYMEKRLIKYVDHIITVDDPFKKYYEKLSGKNVTRVMNCKSLIFDKYEPSKNKKFTIVYIGIMIKGRFFPDIIDLIGGMDDAKLILAGKKEGLYYEMKEYAKKYDNIDFLGTISSKDILNTTKKGDVTFILVDGSNKQTKFVVFNKQFEAMVCGRPIIITKDTYAGKMTEELKCGLAVEYNKEAIKQAIIKLKDNPDICEKLGRNAFNAAKKQYNWNIEKKNLIKVYEEIK